MQCRHDASLAPVHTTAFDDAEIGTAIAQIERQLPKMAGADLNDMPLDQQGRALLQTDIRTAFLRGVRIVMIEAAGITLLSALAGLAVQSGAAKTSPASRRSA